MTSAMVSCAAAVETSGAGAQAVAQQSGAHSSQHADIGTPPEQRDGECQSREPPAWRQGAILLFCWGVFVMFTLLLSHYHRCSPAYWSIFAVQAATCIGAEALFIRLVGFQLPRLA